MPQRVTGHKESLHLEIADLHRLPVFEQMIPVRDGHGVFQAEGADLLTVPGIGEIVFLALAQINPGVLKSILLTNIQAARMIWVSARFSQIMELAVRSDLASDEARIRKLKAA